MYLSRYLFYSLTSIIALSPLSWSAPAPANHTLSIGRRAPDAPLMVEWLDQTFRGFVRATGPMKRDAVQELAKAAYDQIKDGDGVQLVAALLVPDVGVFLSSIPRGPNMDAVLDNSKAEAPAWSHATANRVLLTKNKDAAKYHAEDGACYYYESTLLGGSKFKAGGTYPDFTYITIWGKRSAKAKAAQSTSPCTTEDAKIDPSCWNTLQMLHIQF